MRRVYSRIVKMLLIFVLGTTGSTAVFAEVLDVGAHSSTFGSNVRGFWFTAPSNFTITGLDVPTDASAADFSVAVLRHNPGTPFPTFATTTNDFTTLHYSTNNAGVGFISVSIPVLAGQVIGILGNRGDINSYRSAPYASTIGGLPVTLTRFGMQQPLSTNAPANVWSEAAGSLSRIFVEINGVSNFTVGGNVTGLAPGDSIILQNNGGDDLIITANGSYSFATPIDNLLAYNVTVLASQGYVCNITNGSGNIANAPITNIDITCVSTIPTTVPTLSEWALMLLTLLLLLVSVPFSRKRQG